MILVRAKAADAALYEAVRLYYDYEYATQGEKQLANFMVANRSLPLRFCCGGEQGPLNYHLLTSTFRNRTRMVPWLLRDVDITSCDTDFIYPTRHPSFIHFSGCTAKTSSGKSRAHLCVPLVCREDEEGIEVATEEASDAWVSRYELRLSQMFVGTPKTAQLKSELPSPVSAESLLSRIPQLDAFDPGKEEACIQQRDVIAAVGLRHDPTRRAINRGEERQTLDQWRASDRARALRLRLSGHQREWRVDGRDLAPFDVARWIKCVCLEFTHFIAPSCRPHPCPPPPEPHRRYPPPFVPSSSGPSSAGTPSAPAPRPRPLVASTTSSRSRAA